MFVPHVSIAYYNTREDNRSIVEVLDRFRAFNAGTVSVEAIELVRTPRPAAGHCRWTTLAILPLGR